MAKNLFKINGITFKDLKFLQSLLERNSAVLKSTKQEAETYIDTDQVKFCSERLALFLKLKKFVIGLQTDFTRRECLELLKYTKPWESEHQLSDEFINSICESQKYDYSHASYYEEKEEEMSINEPRPIRLDDTHTNLNAADELRKQKFIQELEDATKRLSGLLTSLNPNMLTFRRLQEENKEWVVRNFNLERPTEDKFWMPVFGLQEEVGELCHALLKRAQGIRGTYEEHTENAKDAIGDITVYLADVCSALGFDFQAIIDTTWNQVKQRDWQKNKENGQVGE